MVKQGFTNGRGGGLSVIRALSFDVGGVDICVQRAVSYVVADYIYVSWAMRHVEGNSRIRVLAGTILRTKCRNQLVYEGRWEADFPSAYRALELKDLR